MASGIRDLKVWQEAVMLGGEVARAIHGCSRRETRVLTDRVLHAALDVGTLVAEAYEEPESAERSQLYRRARARLAVLDTLLAATRQAGLLPPQALSQLTSRTGTVGRLLSGYLTFVERQQA